MTISNCKPTKERKKKRTFFWYEHFCHSLSILLCLLLLELQVGPDMLISGFIQPIPDLIPVIPSVEETCAIDPTVTPYESRVIFFYKTWDLYGAFSNFSPHSIQTPDESGDYTTWPSVEHYYQVPGFPNLFSDHKCFVIP